MITWGIAKDASEQAILSHWVAEHIWPGRGRDFGKCQGMAVLEDDALIAGAIWHNWEPDAGVIEISAASTSKRWLTKETLGVLFGVPFNEWGCQVVVLRVSDHDRPLHRMLRAYGFVQYRLPRLRGRNEAENVFILTDDAWRDNKFNRAKSSEA